MAPGVPGDRRVAAEVAPLTLCSGLARAAVLLCLTVLVGGSAAILLVLTGALVLAWSPAFIVAAVPGLCLGWCAVVLFGTVLAGRRCRVTFAEGRLSAVRVLPTRSWLPRFDAVAIGQDEITAICCQEQLGWSLGGSRTEICAWAEMRDGRPLVLASGGPESLVRRIAEEAARRSGLAVTAAPVRSFDAVGLYGGVRLGVATGTARHES